MNGSIKNIIRNASYMYLAQGLNMLLPILILPYLLKTLSVESFGIYSFVFAFSQFILLFVDFGFNISATKKIAENSDNKNLVKQTYWNIIFIKFLLSFISFIFVCGIIFFVPKMQEYRTGILWSYLMILGTVLFPLWWFQGMNKMKELALMNAISKVLVYPLMFFFVIKSTDYQNAIIIQSLSYVLAGIFSCFYIFNNYRFYFIDIHINKDKKTYLNEMREAFPIFLSNSTISLYTNSLTIMLGIFSTNYNVGLFGAMERVVRMICFGVLAPINQVSFPIIAKMKQENFIQAKELFQKIFWGTLGILVMVYLAFLIGKDQVMIYFFEGYTGIDKMLMFFMLMIFPIALGGVLGQLGLLALGGEKEKNIFSQIYLWVGLLSLPFSLFFILFYELKGTIIVMMSVEMLIFLLFFLYVRRNLIYFKS